MKYKKINNIKIAINEDQEEFIFITSKHLTECIEYINLHPKTKVIVRDLYEEDNISFLKECTNVQEITLDCQFIKDLSGLNYLKKIRSLSLSETTIIDGKNTIDLEAESFTSLEVLYLTWSKKIKGMHSLKNLKELCIWKYAPKECDLTEFANLCQLENLIIRQAKIHSLKGIENLKNLKELELSYIRTLETIRDLTELGAKLKRLEISSCKHIKDFDSLKYMEALEVLMFDKCGEIPSIDFVKELYNLKHFVFPDTIILNGDITPCFHINYVYFDNKKHYSHKWDDFDNWVNMVK
ncbi:leucine-rich repeat domain-containing protein [Gottfriedia sp. NPDC057991]|uniref:leucine-rich repeat domain-containing protein n=1 Tax=Gottfriedia sp. NPDC057991 TaxID=3346298 RepID=UPI0036D7E263